MEYFSYSNRYLDLYRCKSDIKEYMQMYMFIHCSGGGTWTIYIHNGLMYSITRKCIGRIEEFTDDKWRFCRLVYNNGKNKSGWIL